MRNDRMRMLTSYHTRFVTILGDAIRASLRYLAGMDIPTAMALNGQSGHAPDASHGYYPIHYHRSISLAAWIGLLASGGICWAFILTSI